LPRKIEAIENGAYRIRHLKVDAEVGDSKVAGFKPKLKLKRWGGECFLDIDFADETTEEEIEEETDGEGNITKVKWKIKTVDGELELEYHVADKARLGPIISGACNGCGKCCEVWYQGRLGYCQHFDVSEPDKCKIHINRLEQYWREDETYEEWLVRRNPECPNCFRAMVAYLPAVLPECGFNLDWGRTGISEETLLFDIVLKKKPKSNILSFQIKAKDLRFSYQPFLTIEDRQKCIVRPPNVEGSYAVYHISKKNNEYETGKAFHIYRPTVEDALGNKIWCSINFDKYIDPTTMTITIPQQFLDEATYPITLDPDFGYAIIGGAAAELANNTVSYRLGSAWTMPAGGGTANYLRAYIGGNVACDCKAFINQKDSGGAGTHGQIATKENLACVADAGHWEEFTLASEVLTGGVDYILNILGNGADAPQKTDTYAVWYDVNGALASYVEAPQNYGAPESPWVATAEVVDVADFSIYVNYTELGWTGKISGVTDPAEIQGVAKADIAEVKGVA